MSYQSPTTRSSTFAVEPKRSDESSKDDMEQSLIVDLEHMSLKRRSIDRLSVEGSPISNPESKRLDISKTPSDKGIDPLWSASTGKATPQLILRIKRGKKSENDIIRTPLQKENLNVGNQVLIIPSIGNDDHLTGDGHQENALRTSLLCGPKGCLRRENLEDSLVWAPEGQEYTASISDLLRCHEYAYLRHIQEKCDAAKGGGVHADFTVIPSFYAGTGMLDSDTPVGPTSLQAAKRFCGAAMFAVDCLLGNDAHIRVPSLDSSDEDVRDGEEGGDGDGDGYGDGDEVGERRGVLRPITRSFVIGRPPGHHCGPNGAVVSNGFWKRPEMASSGFCLLNTAAVAGAYARYKYGRSSHLDRNSSIDSNSSSCKFSVGSKMKVAIVDIDVHHGNGTEACIRNLVPHREAMPLPSSWAPQWFDSYKPWLDESDARDTFFGSISLVAGDGFYPGGGEDSCSSHDPVTGQGSNVVNIALTPVGPGPWDLKARAQLSEKKRKEACVQASRELRTKVAENLLPQLMDFAPDLLIISAGFDAHYDDMYHFLTESDFHWLTEQLCETAATCGGRVLSVLEGGYSLASPLPKPQKVKVPAAQLPRRETRNNAADIVKGEEGEASPAPDFQVAIESRQGQILSEPDALSLLPGDGGLVKGVMAHVAALAGRSDWL